MSAMWKIVDATILGTSTSAKADRQRERIARIRVTAEPGDVSTGTRTRC